MAEGLRRGACRSAALQIFFNAKTPRRNDAMRDPRTGYPLCRFRQRLLVNILQQPRFAEFSMHLNGHIHDDRRDLIPCHSGGL